ncbi:hypothetical protein [Streptomyces coelicoflavus]
MHLWDTISAVLTAVGIGLELARIRRELKRATEEAAASAASRPGEPAEESDTQNSGGTEAEGTPESDGA